MRPKPRKPSSRSRSNVLLAGGSRHDRSRRRCRDGAPMLLTDIFDRVCPPLIALIEQQRMPSRMHVHPTVYSCISLIRENEIAAGYPLMVLGMELVADADVPVNGFQLVA